MVHYIISFTVYTLAMAGLIALALFVYKKVLNSTALSKNSKILSIEETMMINPRKTLMIVKAGNERFLIASDIDKTTLIAKLNSNDNILTSIKNDSLQNEIPDVDLGKESFSGKEIDLLYPAKSVKTDTINNKKSKTLKNKDKDEKIVHFEVISDKNPNASISRKSRASNRGKNVTIDVGVVKNHGLSPIKEIVHKLNEI